MKYRLLKDKDKFYPQKRGKFQICWRYYTGHPYANRRFGRSVDEAVEIIEEDGPFIEWIGDATTPHPPPPRDTPEVPKPIGPLVPNPPPKIIIKEDVNKEFFKGMVWAFLIIILLHIGLAYVLFY